MTLRQFVLASALSLLGISAPGQARAVASEFAFDGTAIAILSQDTRTGGPTGPSNVPASLASFLVDGSTVLGSFSINSGAEGFVLPSGIAKGGTRYLLNESKVQFDALSHAGGPTCDAFFADCSLVVFNDSDVPLGAGLRTDRLFLSSFRQFATNQPSDISYLLAQFIIEEMDFGFPGAPPPDLYPNDLLASVLPTLDSARADNRLRYSLIYFGQTVSGVQFRRTFDLQDVSFGPVGAVPEPSTWVMGLAGLAVLGWTRRRQRRPAG